MYATDKRTPAAARATEALFPLAALLPPVGVEGGATVAVVVTVGGTDVAAVGRVG